MTSFPWYECQVLAAIAVLACAGIVAGATGAPPVISIANCTQVCSGLPARLTPMCGVCIIEKSDISRWSSAGQVGPLQRLPLYEVNYRNQAATIMVRNDEMLAPAPPMFLASYLNANYGSLGNMTLCRNGTSCTTAPVGSVTSVTADGKGTCTSSRGWTVPWYGLAGVGSFPQPDCNPNVTNNLWDSGLQKVENTVFTTLLRGREIYRPEGLAISTAALTDVNAAARSIWRAAQAHTGSALSFHNVTDTSRLKTLYGAEYDPVWDQWAVAGDLVELDLTAVEGFSPDKDMWTPGAHVILRYTKTAQGAAELVAVAVRLSNVKGSTAFKVYTPAKSASAFIMATLVARVAMNDGLGQIWCGHVYYYHNLQLAASYALMNTIEPEKGVGNATHPVRQALDLFAGPKTVSGFNGALFSGLVVPPPNSATLRNGAALPELFEICATKSPQGGPANFWTVTIEEQLRRGGLHPARFTSSAAWDQYPLAQFLKQISDKAVAYTTAIVNEFYANDAAVAGDTAVQAMVEFMLRPDGANLGAINAANEIKTRTQLAGVMGQIVFMSLGHGLAQLPDYLNHLGAVTMWPLATELRELPDPQGVFTTEDIIAAGPGTNILAGSLEFQFAFTARPPITMLVPSASGKPGGAPVWDANLPFTNARANAVLVAFRKDYANFVYNAPGISNLIKSTNTAWGAPTSIPLVIET